MTEEYEHLIEFLIKDGYLKTPEIIEAFRAIYRGDFVLEECVGEACVNAPLPIGYDQTISQPLVVAFMLELLAPKQGEKILDVGAGSGWTAALLAYLVSNQSSGYGLNAESGGASVSPVLSSPLVVAIERIPELADFAEKNIFQYNFIEKGIVKIIKADGSKGYSKVGPYDKILGGAASAGDVPVAWRRQLKIGGRIVAPVDQSVWVIDKTGPKSYTKKEYFGFSFVPLVKD